MLCRCQPEPDVDAHFEASYQAGYGACLADGYCERPMTEWVYLTGSRVTWDAEARCLRHHMTPLRFAGLTWRTHHASAWAYGRWFERQYGHDLESYLVGYDDAGAGLPSAVCDPRAHARAEAALGACEPTPDLDEEPDAMSIQSPPEAVGADDWMPF
ncbi:MAG: hypothetical protein AAGI91_16520 [Bacteroidota bacterium]